jgi:hypothetical protein
MFNILCRQGNENQKYIMILSHPSQNGYHQKWLQCGAWEGTLLRSIGNVN